LTVFGHLAIDRQKEFDHAAETPSVHNPTDPGVIAVRL
jgi:hypothetical protein